MKRISIVLLAAVMAFGTAFAKDQSVAFIDMNYILKNLPQYEQANEQLTMLSKRWQILQNILHIDIRDRLIFSKSRAKNHHGCKK